VIEVAFAYAPGLADKAEARDQRRIACWTP